MTKVSLSNGDRLMVLWRRALTKILIFAGGTKEASVLVYLGHLGSVACPGLPRSADPMESHCRGIFSHRG